jgi:hypothetical protein
VSVPALRGPLIALATAVVTVSACSPRPEDVAGRDAFLDAVDTTPNGESIDIAALAPEGSVQLGIFPPYSVNADARDTLGFTVPIEEMSPWRSTEGGSVFVFASEGQVLAWWAVPWEELDTFCVEGPVAVGLDDRMVRIADGLEGPAVVSDDIPACQDGWWRTP